MDRVLRSKYLAPGYLSCGGVPSKYDTMTDTELKAMGKRKKNTGFEGTNRCYLDKIIRMGNGRV